MFLDRCAEGFDPRMNILHRLTRSAAPISALLLCALALAGFNDAAAWLPLETVLMSVLVLALYVNSDTVRTLYHRPEAIWLLCPLLLYWLGRVWLITRRGDMHHDPVTFALTDPASLWVGFAAGACLAFAL